MLFYDEQGYLDYSKTYYRYIFSHIAIISSVSLSALITLVYGFNSVETTLFLADVSFTSFVDYVAHMLLFFVLVLAITSVFLMIVDSIWLEKFVIGNREDNFHERAKIYVQTVVDKPICFTYDVSFKLGDREAKDTVYSHLELGVGTKFLYPLGTDVVVAVVHAVEPIFNRSHFDLVEVLKTDIIQ